METKRNILLFCILLTLTAIVLSGCRGDVWVKNESATLRNPANDNVVIELREGHGLKPLLRLYLTAKTKVAITQKISLMVNILKLAIYIVIAISHKFQIPQAEAEKSERSLLRKFQTVNTWFVLQSLPLGLTTHRGIKWLTRRYQTGRGVAALVAAISVAG